ncbi:MAG: acyl carrier protein [Clostridia bacterium]|nr:acyl carrier protein [Clostridia bacterium]
MNVIEDLKQIFENFTGNDLPDFNEDTLLTADMGLNSFELFDLICEIEEHFGIEIPDRELMKLVTLGDLVRYIDSEVN